jgi:alkylhydroperoxidase family enzyme
MSWLPPADGRTPLDRVFGHCPEIYARYRDFAGRLWWSRPADPILLELCRLRIAQLLGCDAELAVRYAPARAAGLDEGKIAALPTWPTHPAYSSCERACLGFAEQFVVDPHGISDDAAAAVTAHLSAPEMVTFTEALAVFDGFMRFRLLLGVGATPTGVCDPGPDAASAD